MQKPAAITRQSSMQRSYQVRVQIKYLKDYNGNGVTRVYVNPDLTPLQRAAEKDLMHWTKIYLQMPHTTTESDPGK